MTEILALSSEANRRLADPNLYETTRSLVHNKSPLQRDGRLVSFTTPREVWFYAVEFPRGAAVPEAEYLVVRVKVKISHGSIGVGIVKKNSNEYIQEIQVVASEDWQEVAICVPGKAPLGSLICRNVSHSGSSEATIELLPIEIVDAPAIEPAQKLEIDASPLDRFTTWAGNVPAGYSADWTGIKTRATVQKYSTSELIVYHTPRFEAPTVEFKTEQVIDWLPLADAVTGSGETFRMAALGAGWGRWLAAGGALARQLGKTYYLIGVEADPDHFSWMTQHLSENGFDPRCCRLIEAAASNVAGTCLFEVGDPVSWYGQSIVKYDDPNKKTRIVRAVTIEEILEGGIVVDYLHLDIQGAELDVLSAEPDVIDTQVRTINVGTHSAEIESGLRQLLNRLGWKPLYDVKMGSSMRVCVGDHDNIVHFGDGAQVWRNLKL